MIHLLRLVGYEGPFHGSVGSTMTRESLNRGIHVEIMCVGAMVCIASDFHCSCLAGWHGKVTLVAESRWFLLVMAETKRELLPSDALPEHYDLTLEPDIEKFAFDGVVKITCDVQARGPGEQ